MNILFSANRLTLLALIAATVFTADVKAQDALGGTATRRRLDPEGPVSFISRGDELHMTGTIDGQTLYQLHAVLSANPQATTIVMNNVPGSSDDEAALSLFRFVRSRNLTISVPATGKIASGGVDFLCAGVKRVVHRDAQILVHPWRTDWVRADQLPRSDWRHQSYINYYAAMGIDPEFYWHTLTAPRKDIVDGQFVIEDMHPMSAKDLQRFRVATSIVSENTPAADVSGLAPFVGTWVQTIDGVDKRIRIREDGTCTTSIQRSSPIGLYAPERSHGSANVSGNVLTLRMAVPARPGSDGYRIETYTVNGMTPNRIDTTAGPLVRTAVHPALVETDLKPLVGTWTFDAQVSEGTVSITADGRFSYRSQYFTAEGSVAREGQTLTMNFPGTPHKMTIQDLSATKVTFTDAVWTRDIQQPAPSPASELDGTWREVRLDFAPSKVVTIRGGYYSESTATGVNIGSVRIAGSVMTIDPVDGSTETFKVGRENTPAGMNKIRFFKLNGEPTNFYWIRD